jgi:hypothetical protein
VQLRPAGLRCLSKKRTRKYEARAKRVNSLGADNGLTLRDYFAINIVLLAEHYVSYFLCIVTRTGSLRSRAGKANVRFW